MSIFDVQHQPRAHRMVQRALACERTPHAYVFAGPAGVGKEMLASRLAKLLLCASPVERKLPKEVAAGWDATAGVDACGQCEECTLFNAGTHPDFSLIHRQLNKQHPDQQVRKRKALMLSVEVIRHFLIDRLSTSPARGRAKVFIVREAERLSESAQNSPLKSLEEPPHRTFIILLANALERLLTKTRSRCQQVVFQTLPDAFIESQLSSLRPDAGDKASAFAARQAMGSIGTALQLIDDGVHALKTQWGEKLAELASARRGFAPTALAKPFEADAKQLAEHVKQRDPDVSDTDSTRAGLQTLIAALASFYNDALRSATGAALTPINADQPKIIQAIASAHTTDQLQQALRRLSEAEYHLSRNAHIELALETLFIQLTRAARRAA